MWSENDSLVEGDFVSLWPCIALFWRSISGSFMSFRNWLTRAHRYLRLTYPVHAIRDHRRETNVIPCYYTYLLIAFYSGHQSTNGHVGSVDLNALLRNSRLWRRALVVQASACRCSSLLENLNLFLETKGCHPYVHIRLYVHLWIWKNVSNFLVICSLWFVTCDFRTPCSRFESTETKSDLGRRITPEFPYRNYIPRSVF